MDQFKLSFHNDNLDNTDNRYSCITFLQTAKVSHEILKGLEKKLIFIFTLNAKYFSNYLNKNTVAHNNYT